MCFHLKMSYKTLNIRLNFIHASYVSRQRPLTVPSLILKIILLIFDLREDIGLTRLAIDVPFPSDQDCVPP